MDANECIALQEIRDVLSRYCRGLDRMDKEMAYGVWSANATANYVDMYEGSGRGFIDWVWESHRAMSRHSHQITNVLCELDLSRGRATSEAYVTVALWLERKDDGPQTEIVARGRYLDRWSKGPESWTIDHRTHVLDMQSLSQVRAGPVSGASRRDDGDASFDFIAKA